MSACVSFLISVYTYVDNNDEKLLNMPFDLSDTDATTNRHPMSSSLRMGVLTPSSNTALEPLTTAIAQSVPGASVHFARFKVTEIALAPTALGQFDDSKILAAAELLADARVDVIGWSGTSSGWLGFEADRRLCERIQSHTGIPATTAVLALNDLLRLKGIRRLALVTPYTQDVQMKIVEQYRGLGIDIVAERHLGIRENHAFASIKPDDLLDLIEDVARSGPEAVTTFCTNLRAAPLAEEVEARFGIPLLDTVSTTVWGMLRATGTSPAAITGWGGLFQWT